VGCVVVRPPYQLRIESSWGAYQATKREVKILKAYLGGNRESRCKESLRYHAIFEVFGGFW